MNVEQPALNDFIRHAERFGTEFVYETALEHLKDPRELGLLSLALQRVDRHWRLERQQQASLTLALYEAGIPTARICAMAQLSRRTLHRLRQRSEEVAEVAKPASDSAQPYGADVPKPATPSEDIGEAENGTTARAASLQGGRP
jgi:hypothetical protein